MSVADAGWYKHRTVTVSGETYHVMSVAGTPDIASVPNEVQSPGDIDKTGVVLVRGQSSRVAASFRDTLASVLSLVDSTVDRPSALRQVLAAGDLPASLRFHLAHMRDILSATPEPVNWKYVDEMVRMSDPRTNRYAADIINAVILASDAVRGSEYLTLVMHYHGSCGITMKYHADAAEKNIPFGIVPPNVTLRKVGTVGALTYTVSADSREQFRRKCAAVVQDLGNPGQGFTSDPVGTLKEGMAFLDVSFTQLQEAHNHFTTYCQPEAGNPAAFEEYVERIVAMPRGPSNVSLNETLWLLHDWFPFTEVRVVNTSCQGDGTNTVDAGTQLKMDIANAVAHSQIDLHGSSMKDGPDPTTFNFHDLFANAIAWNHSGGYDVGYAVDSTSIGKLLERFPSLPKSVRERFPMVGAVDKVKLYVAKLVNRQTFMQRLAIDRVSLGVSDGSHPDYRTLMSNMYAATHGAKVNGAAVSEIINDMYLSRGANPTPDRAWTDGAEIARKYAFPLHTYRQRRSPSGDMRIVSGSSRQGRPVPRSLLAKSVSEMDARHMDTFARHGFKDLEGSTRMFGKFRSFLNQSLRAMHLMSFFGIMEPEVGDDEKQLKETLVYGVARGTGAKLDNVKASVSESALSVESVVARLSALTGEAENMARYDAQFPSLRSERIFFGGGGDSAKVVAAIGLACATVAASLLHPA